MAVFPKLKDFWNFFPFVRAKDEPPIRFVQPQPPESLAVFAEQYEVYPLTLAQLDELWRLDCRCFVDGEAYTRETLEFLLGEPNNLSFRIVLKTGAMVGFVISMLEEDGTGHITTIGIAPEHRRRGLGFRLLERAEKAFLLRDVRLMRLEVRAANASAQELYLRAGYSVMQRLARYYSNGGDGLLMVKSIG